MQHRDSVGNTGNLEPGAVQWMTAGAGVVHSEMPSDKLMEEGGTLEGFQVRGRQTETCAGQMPLTSPALPQLWVNLPARDKMISPHYQDTPPESIPTVSTEDGQVTVRVIAGRSLGQNATISTRTPIMVLVRAALVRGAIVSRPCLTPRPQDVRMQAGSPVFTQDVPPSHNGFAYVYRGEGVLGANDKLVREGQMVLLGGGDAFPMRATDKSECRLLLIAGGACRRGAAQRHPR